VKQQSSEEAIGLTKTTNTVCEAAMLKESKMNCPDRESVTEQFIVQFQGKTTFGVDRVQYVLHEAELRNIRKHGRENTGGCHPVALEVYTTIDTLLKNEKKRYSGKLVLFDMP
jgi:hypothetical protein